MFVGRIIYNPDGLNAYQHTEETTVVGVYALICAHPGPQPGVSADALPRCQVV